MAVTGSLRDLNAEQLVNVLVLARNTGALSLESQGHRATVYLEEGEPVYASLDQERIGLAQALRDSGRLTLEQIRLILSLSRATTDEELARLLVNAGIVSREDIFESLQSRVLEIVQRILPWDDGSFRFEPDKVLTAEPVAPAEAPEAAEEEPAAVAEEKEAEEVETPIEEVAEAPPTKEEAAVTAVEPPIPEPVAEAEAETPAEEEEAGEAESELAAEEEAPAEPPDEDLAEPEGKPPSEEETTPPDEETTPRPVLKRPDIPSARRLNRSQDDGQGGITSSRHPSSRRREVDRFTSLEEPLSTAPALSPAGPASHPTTWGPPSLPEVVGGRSTTVVEAIRERRFDQLAAVLRLPRLSERRTAWAMALGYLLLIAVAELVVTFFEPRVGLAVHGAVLIVLLIHSALASGHSYHGLLLSLSLAPLIRMLSLSMPLVRFPVLYWYLIISVPLFVATILAARNLDLSWQQLGLAVRNIPVQFAVGLCGIAVGVAEYWILEPEPLISGFYWQELVVAGLILVVCTGFGEELIFRGLMQPVAEQTLGRVGLFYVALLFAVLHVGYRSLLDVLLVFLVAMFFGVVVQKTRSLVGVSIAHGLTNVVLFLIMPFA